MCFFVKILFMSAERKYLLPLLPFNITKAPVRISQGNNGPWSHYLTRREIPGYPSKLAEADLTYAVDFALPLRSEVIAAKNGRVLNFWLESDYCYEGLDPQIGNNLPPMSTNFIAILHADRTIAWYTHLDKAMILNKNKTVNAGEIIALTGKSGWIAEVPHLHFQVNKLLKSIPIAFENYHGSLDHQTLINEGKI